MQTLSTIQAEEQNRRERALRYESLQGDLVSLRTGISRLETQATDVEALRKILELCPSIAPTLVTSGRGTGLITVPGGANVRAVAAGVIADALASAERSEAERKRLLAEKRKQLAKVEEALAEFEQ